MTDPTLQARLAGIIERTCYEQGGEIQAADSAAKQILEALSSRQVTEDDVERVSQIIFDFDAKHRSDEFIDSDACARAVIAAMQERMGRYRAWT